MSYVASPELLKKPCIKCGAVDRYKRGNCKPCALAKGRKNRKANPEKVVEYYREYHKANRKRITARRREYYRANRKKLTEYSRQWKKANPAKTATHRASRRTRVSGNGGTFTTTEWFALLTHYKHTCLCCGRNDVRLYADHIISIANGGTSDISNIQPLCQYCNTSKGTNNTDFRPNSGVEFVYTRPRQLKLFDSSL